VHYAKVRYRDTAVSYLPQLDGGGMHFGQEFVRVVPERIDRGERPAHRGQLQGEAARCLLEGRRLKYARPSQYYYLLVRPA
jgi:hypothetical protein